MDSTPYPPESDAGKLQAAIRAFDQRSDDVSMDGFTERVAISPAEREAERFEGR